MVSRRGGRRRRWEKKCGWDDATTLRERDQRRNTCMSVLRQPCYLEYSLRLRCPQRCPNHTSLTTHPPPLQFPISPRNFMCLFFLLHKLTVHLRNANSFPQSQSAISSTFPSIISSTLPVCELVNLLQLVDRNLANLPVRCTQVPSRYCQLLPVCDSGAVPNPDSR